MTDGTDRVEKARRNLADMEALIADHTPKIRIENGIRRGEKHSDRTLPVRDDGKRPAKGPKAANAARR
jgi:hypothetical protein